MKQIRSDQHRTIWTTHQLQPWRDERQIHAWICPTPIPNVRNNIDVCSVLPTPFQSGRGCQICRNPTKWTGVPSSSSCSHLQNAWSKSLMKTLESIFVACGKFYTLPLTLPMAVVARLPGSLKSIEQNSSTSNLPVCSMSNLLKRALTSTSYLPPSQPNQRK